MLLRHGGRVGCECGGMRLLESRRVEEQHTLASFSIDHIADAVFLISMEGRILNINAAACALMERSREELLRMSVFDLDPEYAKEDIPTDITELKRIGRKHSTRCHTTRDGRRVPVEITSNYLKSDDSEYICSVVRDISERVRAEKEALFFRTLIEYTGDPVYVLDPHDGWRIVYVNQAACRHYGLDLDVLRTMRIPDWDPAFDMNSAAGMWEKLKEGQSFLFETVHRVASGELAPVEITTSYLEHDGKEYAAGYFHDISDRKRAEEVLRESEERYRGLVELFPEAVYVHTGGKLIFANLHGARLLGVERPEELYGREALDFVHPDYRGLVSERITSAFDEGAPNPPVEEVFVRCDGSPVHVEVSSVAYTIGGKKALQIVARDISDRKKIQNERIRAQKLESLGVLAGGIAHDFNNILTSILGNLSVARMRIEPDHAIASRLEQCEKATIQAAELARQLLTFSRGGEPVKRLISVGSLISDIVPFTLRGTNVISRLKLSDGLWCINADEAQVGQILNNLLLNAAQAMPSGGEVLVSARNVNLDQDNPQQLPAGEYVRISVRDNGCGIAPEHLSRIFDPYFTTKPQGSGLGLASVYSIIKRHNGAIEVTSNVGEGSCFTFCLPALSGSRLEDDASVAGDPLPSGNGAILIMDDDELICEVVKEILLLMNFEVVSCSDGRRAIELYQEAYRARTPFKAVILDLTVPNGMGGKEAAASIRDIDPGAVLIVSSGYSDDPVTARYRDYGFDGTIPKPFSVGELARELGRLLPEKNSFN